MTVTTSSWQKSAIRVAAVEFFYWMPSVFSLESGIYTQYPCQVNLSPNCKKSKLWSCALGAKFCICLTTCSVLMETHWPMDCVIFYCICICPDLIVFSIGNKIYLSHYQGKYEVFYCDIMYKPPFLELSLSCTMPCICFCICNCICICQTYSKLAMQYIWALTEEYQVFRCAIKPTISSTTCQQSLLTRVKGDDDIKMH